MTYEALLKDLKGGRYSPLYFLHGEEPFFIDKIADYIEQNVLNEGEKAFNQVVLYGKDTEFKTVVDEARQFPMMSSYRVIILREAQDMKTLPELENYFENPSKHAILVICHKYKKIDKRTKFAKIIEQAATVFESKKLYDNQIAPWIIDYVKGQGHSIDVNAAALMAEYLGADLSKVSNELDKVFISIPKGTSITQADIQEQIGISKEFTVFALQSALAERNFVKANIIIRYFIENPKQNPAILVINSLFSFFNKVYIGAYHKKEAEPILLKKIGVNSYYGKEYILASKNYSIQHLHNIFQVLKQADMHSKGIGARHADESTILKDILIACMSK